MIALVGFESLLASRLRFKELGMKQAKTRKDFYLEEDYEAYRAQFEFEAFIREKLDLNLANTTKLLGLAEKIHDTGYHAGYANAEFDAAER